MSDIVRYQADYLADEGFERHMVRYRRRRVLKCLADIPHNHVLEVGCGMEPLFEHLTHWKAFTVVEPAPLFAENARQLVPPGSVVRVHEGFLEDLVETLNEKAYDVIVASSLLHEIADAEKFLCALGCLCNANTRVHLNVPNAASLHNRMAVSMGIVPSLFTTSTRGERLQRKATYDAARLRSLVEGAGFVVESSGSYFLKPFTHQQLQQMVTQKLISVAALDALYEVCDDFPDAGAEIFVMLRRE